MTRPDPLRVLEEIFQKIEHAIVIVDADGIVRSANPCALRSTLYQADQIKGLPIHTLFERNADRDRLGNPEHWTGSNVLCTATGGRKRVTLAAKTLSDLDPGLGTMISFMDADSRPGNVLAGHPMEQFFKLMIRAKVVLYMVDPVSREFTYLDPSFESVFGYTVDDIHRMGGREQFLTQVLQADGYAIHRDLVESFSTGDSGNIVSCETWWKCKDGSLVCMDERMIGIHEGGGLIAVQGILRDITLRKMTEKALLDERILLRTLIDNLPDAIYAKDAEGRKTLSNKADLVNIGAETESEVLGKTDFDLFPADLASGFFADDQAVIQTGCPVVNREEYVFDEEGNKRWVHTSKVPLRDEQGRIIGLIGIGHDITRKKLADDIARESQRQFSDIIQFFPVATMVIDLSGRVIAWNQVMENLTRTAAKDMLGKGDFAYAVPLYGSRRPILVDHLLNPAYPLGPEYTDVKRGEDLISASVRREGVGGRRRFLHVTAKLLRKDDGSVSGAIESILDLTAQEEAQEALRSSEERFRLISENVADLIAVLEQDGMCRYASASWYQEGYEPDVLVGTNLFTYIHPEDLESVLQGIQSLLERRTPQSLQFRLHRSDSQWNYKEASISLLVSNDGAHIVAVMHDISERIANDEKMLSLQRRLSDQNADLERTLSEMRQMQEGLVQSEKLASIGQLTAGIAHEINNPLAFVSSNLNRFTEYFDEMTGLVRLWDSLAPLARNSKECTARLAEILEAERRADTGFLIEDFARLMKHTKEGTERIRSIVERLRGFTHAAGNDFFEADVNAAIDDTIELTWNELKYKATIQREYSEIPKIACNIGEIKQVLVNLLVNAAHAIRDKGTITIRTFRRETSVVVIVEDTGVGISPANLKRIFDPFFTTKAVGKGTGLGLWISATLIQKHQGKIQAQSQEGVGTTMTIELPVEQIEPHKPSL